MWQVIYGPAQDAGLALIGAGVPFPIAAAVVAGMLACELALVCVPAILALAWAHEALQRRRAARARIRRRLGI